MARPLLFDSIKRSKFNKLSEKVKNYLIKEDDGSISTYIAKLEGSGGEAESTFVVTFTVDEGEIVEVDKSFEEIYDALENNLRVIGKVNNSSFIFNVDGYDSEGVAFYCCNSYPSLTIYIKYYNDGRYELSYYPLENRLPDPTGHTGEFLTVAGSATEPEWGFGTPSSSNNFIVTYTNNSGTYTADKTLAEIYSAYQSGANIIGYWAERSDFLQLQSPPSENRVDFYGFEVIRNHDLQYIEIIHFPDSIVVLDKNIATFQ